MNWFKKKKKKQRGRFLCLIKLNFSLAYSKENPLLLIETSWPRTIVVEDAVKSHELAQSRIDFKISLRCQVWLTATWYTFYVQDSTNTSDDFCYRLMRNLSLLMSIRCSLESMRVIQSLCQALCSSWNLLQGTYALKSCAHSFFSFSIFQQKNK